MKQDWSIKYVSHKGTKCKVTVKNTTRKNAIRFIRKFIGKPYKIKQLGEK